MRVLLHLWCGRPPLTGGVPGTPLPDGREPGARAARGTDGAPRDPVSRRRGGTGRRPPAASALGVRQHTWTRPRGTARGRAEPGFPVTSPAPRRSRGAASLHGRTPRHGATIGDDTQIFRWPTPIAGAPCTPWPSASPHACRCAAAGSEPLPRHTLPSRTRERITRPGQLTAARARRPDTPPSEWSSRRASAATPARGSDHDHSGPTGQGPAHPSGRGGGTDLGMVASSARGTVRCGLRSARDDTEPAVDVRSTGERLARGFRRPPAGIGGDLSARVRATRPHRAPRRPGPPGGRARRPDRDLPAGIGRPVTRALPGMVTSVALRTRSGLLAPARRRPEGRAPAVGGAGARRARRSRPCRAFRPPRPAQTASAPPQAAAGRTSSRTVRQHGVDAINFSNEAMQSGQ